MNPPTHPQGPTPLIIDVDGMQAPATHPSAHQDVIMVEDADDAEKVQASLSEKVVVEYLHRRGYNGTASRLHPGVPPTDLALDEADVRNEQLRNVVLMLGRPAELAEHDVKRFEDSYAEFRDWVDNSLDLYKAELYQALYPFLVHSFLEIVKREQPDRARVFLQRFSPEFATAGCVDGGADHSEEVLSLLGVASQRHVEENDTAQLFLKNRYELHLSSYAFELIVAFLSDDQRRHVLLRVLNQHCRVHVDAQMDAPGREKAAEKTGFVGVEEKTGLLHEEVLWGRLRPEQYVIEDADAEPKKDSKKDGKKDEEEEDAALEGTIAESRIPLKKFRRGAQGLETPADAKGRKALYGAAEELSILCYTFMNTKNDGLNCSAISDDGALVAAGFADSSIRVWDARATSTGGGGLGGRANRLVGHGGPVYTAEWSSCGRFLLSGAEDGTVRLWNVGLKSDVAAYRGHNYPVWSVALAKLGHYFASGSHDRTARIWTTDCVRPVRVLAGHLGDVDVVRWHPNCNYVATGSSDRTVRLWDVREGRCVRVFGMQGGAVQAVAFSPDGRSVACGGEGRAVEVWDIAQGVRVKKLMGHRSTVWAMDYSREGGVLASGGADHSVCVWDAREWSRVVAADEEDGGGVREVRKKGESPLVERFETKETPVHSLRFTRRNLLIAAGSFGT